MTQHGGNSGGTHLSDVSEEHHSPCCANCGAVLRDEANFCSFCGHKISTSGSVLSPVQEQKAQVSQQLSHHMLSRAAREGERRQVTVLFADLSSSLTMIDGMDPEQAQSLLDAVLAVMANAVRRYEGAVSQTMGDGILALFGAPLAHEDHALRACCAALAMQDAVQRMVDPSWEARGARPLIRVGLHSGEVAVRVVHSDLSMEYRAVGSTTHIASRIERLATPGSVWLTSQTLGLSRGLLRTRYIGALQVKGLQTSVEAFELTGISTRTRFQANAIRGLSPLVGREGTLQSLMTALEHATLGQRAVAVLSGDPGIGKSRLCYELVQRVSESYRVIEASATSYDQLTPHATLASLARALVGIDDDDDVERTTIKTRIRLAELGMAQLPHLEMLLELVNVVAADRTWPLLDAEQGRRQVEDMLRALLTAVCMCGPTILLFEDLHWCDPYSLGFISRLVEDPPASHTLLLFTHRPELQLEWAHLPHVLVCPIVGLDTDESASLVASLLGPEVIDSGMRTRLAARTVGNPFFIEESVRAVIERLRLQSPTEGMSEDTNNVPDSIDGLLGSRIDRLPEQLLEVLQAAAVIGDHSLLELLRTVLDLPESAFVARLSAVQTAELLYETVPLTGSESPLAPLFRFQHALIQEVVYKRLVQARKRALHSRVVDAFEKTAPTRSSEYFARLAEHAERAERWDKSADYNARACNALASRFTERAIMHLERALAALGRMSAGPAHDLLAIDVRLSARAILTRMGRHEQFVSLLGEAEQYARRLNDPVRLARVLSEMSVELWVTARYDTGQHYAEQALGLTTQLTGGDRVQVELSTRFSLGIIHHARGEFTAALPIMRELAALFTGNMAQHRHGWAGYPSVLTRTFMIAIQNMLGGFAEAERAFREGRAYADEFNHPFSCAMILEQYGMCLLIKGEAESAERLLREALAVCDNDGYGSGMYVPVLSHLGLSLVRLGRHEEAAEVLTRATSIDLRQAGNYARTYLGCAVSEWQRCSGDSSRAQATASAAMKAAAECGERGFYVLALLEHAAALLVRRDTQSIAMDAYHRALAAAQQLDMQPSAAVAYEGLARAHGMQGRNEAANEALRSARMIWRHLGAPARVAQIETPSARPI